MTTADRIRELIEPIVADLGLDLFDLEYGGAQLKVTLDRSGGIDVQAVADATRAISRALDDADPIAGHYTLEVSSPGLERSLRTPAHFAWAAGRQVVVKTVPVYEGERRITGTLREATDDGVVVVLDDSQGGGELRLAYDDIDKARTVFEWGAAPKQTRTKRAKAS